MKFGSLAILSLFLASQSYAHPDSKDPATCEARVARTRPQAATLYYSQGYLGQNRQYAEAIGHHFGDGTLFLRQISGVLAQERDPMAIVEAGNLLKVNIHLSTVTRDGLTLPEGKEIQGATVHYRVNNGPVVDLPVQGLPLYMASMEGSVEIPVPNELGRLAIWASVSKRDGRAAWISNHSRDYEFSIAAEPMKQIGFKRRSDEGKFPVEEKGVLKAGGSLQISYDVKRMDDLGMPDGDPRRGEGRNVFGYIRFEDSEGRDLRTIQWAHPYMQRPASLIVPESAVRVKIWFNGENNHRKQWDSNFEKNFVFEVER